MVEWICKPFKELTPYELYDCLYLRSAVFVVEQNCAYQDEDNKDQYCYHLMGYSQKDLLAYTRIVPPSVIYDECSIGRVVTAASVRKTGIGKLLLNESIAKAYELFGEQPIKIGAQLYLKRFYESFGFRQTSGVYLEDGIEHIYMLKSISS
jgi:ElaA protein